MVRAILHEGVYLISLIHVKSQPTMLLLVGQRSVARKNVVLHATIMASSFGITSLFYEIMVTVLIGQ